MIPETGMQTGGKGQGVRAYFAPAAWGTHNRDMFYQPPISGGTAILGELYSPEVLRGVKNFDAKLKRTRDPRTFSRDYAKLANLLRPRVKKLNP
jgi:hypothetical protein